MYNYKSKKTMLKEKAGVIAGQIWEALNETEHNDGTYRGKHVFVGKCAK